YGQDYHDVIRPRLITLLTSLQKQIGQIEGRGFVDSAPVLERSWALRSGLGWIGKNGNLITKKNGSYFFIATLITDLELIADEPLAKDYCGNCTKCIDACPTEAIQKNKVVDGSKCISYFTIELKDLIIPEKYKGKFEDWIFGCDVCQEVCPWNRFSSPHQHEELKPNADLLSLTDKEWIALTEEKFKQIFKKSAIKRSKYLGIMRNIKFIGGY
ncbi:MAG: tRNA epoxyqueuosine(34) reductase QueG, partial [Bacteroidota bacterium]